MTLVRHERPQADHLSAREAKRREFRDCGVTFIPFSEQALEPIKKLYADLSAGPSTKSPLGRKLHETFPGFENVQMTWHFANCPESIGLFREVLDGSELKCARQILDAPIDQVRVVQASIIEVVGSYPTGRWHTDFTDSALIAGQSATMLTPLYPFQRNFGGLELSAVTRGMPLDLEDYSQVYRYRDGEAVLFDASAMIHRTQGYRVRAGARRVLVCWQLANTARRFRSALKRIGERNGDPMFFSTHRLLHRNLKPANP